MRRIGASTSVLYRSAISGQVPCLPRAHAELEDGVPVFLWGRVEPVGTRQRVWFGMRDVGGRGIRFREEGDQ